MGLDVLIGISSEAPNLDLASAHRPLGVDHDCHPGALFLEHALGGHVDAREPAAVSRVGMVPSHEILWPIHLLGVLQVSHHVLVGISTCVYTSLSGLARESKRVSDVKGVPFEAALKVAHYLNIAS